MTLLNFDVRFTPESGIPRRHHDVSFWPEADIVRADKESKRQFQSKSFCGLLVDYQLRALLAAQLANHLAWLRHYFGVGWR
jgi:hypothetical protein